MCLLNSKVATREEEEEPTRGAMKTPPGQDKKMSLTNMIIKSTHKLSHMQLSKSPWNYVAYFEAQQTTSAILWGN